MDERRKLISSNQTVTPESVNQKPPVQNNTEETEYEDEEEEEETEKSSTSSKSSLSSLAHLSTNEIHNLITQCLKLNAENKISDKNAFQLKMIDCLIYALRNNDPKIDLNLNKASACLDASGKIYGLRVDKLHSEVLKVTGARGEKRKNSEEECSDQNNNNHSKNKKIKKKKTCIINTVDCLKGNLECFNPLSNVYNQIEAQTSDMLLQASLPQHANQGIAINHFNYVVVDEIKIKPSGHTKALVPTINDFATDEISPSFAAFKFTSLLISESESEDESCSDCTQFSSEFRFDINESINICDFSQVEENISERNQNSLTKIIYEKNDVVDLKNIIENDPNNYEYSYMQPNHNIDWKGPPHWKLNLNKTSEVNNSQKICQKLKELRLSFCKTSKKKAEEKFVKLNKSIKFRNWENNLLASFEYNFETEKLFHFFSKEMKYKKNLCESLGDEIFRDDFSNENNLEMSDILQNSIQEETYNDSNLDNSSQLNFSNDPILPISDQPFVDNNLVLAPKLLEKIFIPYSIKAKKIDMRLLKKCTEKALNAESNEKVNSKSFSTVYAELSKNLPKSNRKSLTPALAFMSLLHVVHEKNLNLHNQSDLCDITIHSSEDYNSVCL